MNVVHPALTLFDFCLLFSPLISTIRFRFDRIHLIPLSLLCILSCTLCYMFVFLISLFFFFSFVLFNSHDEADEPA